MNDGETKTSRSEVRPRKEADIPACASALVAVYESDGYPVEGVADPVAWLHPTGLRESWVALLDGEVVGHVLVADPQAGDDSVRLRREQAEMPERLIVLARLFVTSAARGHALGEQLVRAAHNYAEEDGQRLVLDVMTKDQAAIRLYERLGWQRIGTAEHDDGHGRKVAAYCYAAPSLPS